MHVGIVSGVQTVLGYVALRKDYEMASKIEEIISFNEEDAKKAKIDVREGGKFQISAENTEYKKEVELSEDQVKLILSTVDKYFDKAEEAGTTYSDPILKTVFSIGKFFEVSENNEGGEKK